jgi:hypothetical protein
MSTREVRHTQWIDTNIVHKQEAKRVHIVADICRRCRAEVLFSACQFEDGECVLETIGHVLANHGYDTRYADMEVREL